MQTRRQLSLQSDVVADETNKPNFVFILVDDLGQRDLGCYGSTFHETPRIDALAASATMFTDAYA
ncbi:MAG: sulfatase-like hydrolase/transferase, partial [Mariniblastus sp.]